MALVSRVIEGFLRWQACVCLSSAGLQGRSWNRSAQRSQFTPAVLCWHSQRSPTCQDTERYVGDPWTRWIANIEHSRDINWSHFNHLMFLNLCRTLRQTHTHIHTLKRTLTHTLTETLTHSLSLTHTHTDTHTHTHSHTHSQSHSHTHTHTNSHTLTHTLTIKHTHIHN